MAALTADGDSESWVLQKDNVARILEQFNEQDKDDDGVNGVRWDSLPEKVLCRQPYYERLAHYLVYGYKIPKGKKNAAASRSPATPCATTWARPSTTPLASSRPPATLRPRSSSFAWMLSRRPTPQRGCTS